MNFVFFELVPERTLTYFQVARRFEINIQPQLILLQKTLLNVEGLSRQVAPDFNLWESASPQIEKWLKKQVGFVSFFKRIRDNLPLWSEQMPEIPGMLYEVLREAKHQQEELRFRHNAVKMNDDQGQITKTKLGYFTLGVSVSLLATVLFYYFRI